MTLAFLLWLCCIAAASAAMGEIGSQTIAPFAGESLGSLHWVVLQDDWWNATGPEASDPARDPVRSQRNESRT